CLLERICHLTADDQLVSFGPENQIVKDRVVRISENLMPRLLHDLASCHVLGSDIDGVHQLSDVVDLPHCPCSIVFRAQAVDSAGERRYAIFKGHLYLAVLKDFSMVEFVLKLGRYFAVRHLPLGKSRCNGEQDQKGENEIPCFSHVNPPENLLDECDL